MSTTEKFTLPKVNRKEQNHVPGEDQLRPNRMMETPRSNFRYVNGRSEKDSDHHEEPTSFTIRTHPVNRVRKD